MVSVARPFRRWLSVYSIYLQDAIMYRANAMIWLMTDTIPAIIMPLLWLSAYGSHASIRGFTPSRMVVYYLAVLFLTSLIEAHINWEMSEDIKNGKFNIYLSRPFSYRAHQFASNISWRLMRTLVGIPIFAAVLFAFRHWVHFDVSEYYFGWKLWVAVVLAHILSFSMSYTLGLIALFVVEAHSVFMVYYLPLIIFNGQLAPIAFFPHAIAQFAKVLPFVYTLGFPASIFVGQITSAQIWNGYGMQLFWIAFSWIVAAVLWRIGLKHYSAYGI